MSLECDGAGVPLETFQNILRERTAEVKEKAEQKLRHDLQRIREMKSREGMDPVEIFPKEIWEVILNKLDRVDRVKMFHLHDTFRCIMGNSHVQDNLLPLVLKFLEDYIPSADYLNLRLVSKNLRNSVDENIENILVKLLYEGNSLTTSQPPKTIKFNYFQIEEIIELQAPSLPNSDSRHRIVSRSVNVEHVIPMVTHRESFERHLHNVTSFLNRYGDQIWHFSVGAAFPDQQGEITMAYFYNMFIEWLALLPNLRWLKLHINCGYLYYRDCWIEFDFNVLLDHPPPKIKSLERMDICVPWKCGCLHIREGIARSVLLANSQITSVNCFSNWKCDFSPVAVTFLRMENFSDREDTIPFFQMRKFVDINWKLRRINFKMNMKRDSINPVFQYLQKFPSLEEVKLDIKDVAIGDGVDFLELPNLEEFDIEFMPVVIIADTPIHFFFSLQFLLKCKKLRKISWNNKSKDVDGIMRGLGTFKEQGNMIDFGGGMGDLSVSNLWKLFPSMEYIKVTVNVLGENAQCKGRSREYRNRNRELIRRDM